MVESSEVTLNVNVVSVELDKGHAEYLIKIIGPKGINFHVRDRYSQLRVFQSQVRDQISGKVQGSDSKLPEFPQKKWFDNLNRQFLETRRTNIEIFLNRFLNNQHVKSCRLLPVYFRSKALSDNDKTAIEDLCLALQGGNVQKVARQNTAPNPTPKSPMREKPSPPKKPINVLPKTLDQEDFKNHLNEECQKIVNATLENFIDLAQDETEQQFFNQMQQQDKLNELAKVQLSVKPESIFAMPRSAGEGPLAELSTDFLDEISSIDQAMGKKLDSVTEFTNTMVKANPGSNLVLQFNWDKDRVAFAS